VSFGKDKVREGHGLAVPSVTEAPLSAEGETAMTIDERLEALTRNLELLSLESEKHDRQLDRAAKLVTEVAEGTARLLRVVEMHEHRLDSHDNRLDKLE
jgi:hypothetical protein